MRATASVVGLLLVTLAVPARAQICTATTSGLAFGTYDPFASSPAAITGTVTVACQATLALLLSYSVQLGAGTGGTVASRSLGGGSGRLAYQLYTDPAQTQIWGDGTGGTGVVGDSYLLVALGSASRNYTVYGRIPARQAVRPGSYSDVVTVLVVY